MAPVLASITLAQGGYLSLDQQTRLNDAAFREILDLGLHGWAMSRYSGCWVGFKCVADTVESSASVDMW